MPNFATGLAHGLFGAINDQNMQAKEREDAARKNTLTMLGSMLDQVDDDSKPLLFQQMAEVAGLKGKHRSFWDEITGKGRNEVTDALNQKYGDVMGSLVGPGEMAKLRPHMEIQGTAGSTPVEGIGAIPNLVGGMSADQSQGKIGLKSALQDKMKEEAAKIKLQQTYLNQRLADREAAVLQRQQELEDLRQANRKELEDQKSHLKASGDVLKRASVIAAQAGRGIPSDEDKTSAATQIATEQGLNVDKLKTLIGMEAAKTKYFESQAGGAAGAVDGIKPAERIRIDQAQQQNAQGVYSKWADARAKTEAAAKTADTLRAQLNASAAQAGLIFNGQTGTFTKPDGSAPDPNNFMARMVIEKAGGVLKAYNEAMQERVKSEAEMRAHHGTLKANYPDYYETGDEWWAKPKATFGGVAPVGAPRTGGGGGGAVYDATGAYSGPGGKPGNIADGQLIIGTAQTPASKYKVGQLVNYGGMKYKVKAIVPPTEDQPYGAVQFESVK